MMSSMLRKRGVNSGRARRYNSSSVLCQEVPTLWQTHNRTAVGRERLRALASSMVLATEVVVKGNMLMLQGYPWFVETVECAFSRCCESAVRLSVEQSEHAARCNI